VLAPVSAGSERVAVLEAKEVCRPRSWSHRLADQVGVLVNDEQRQVKLSARCQLYLLPEWVVARDDLERAQISSTEKALGQKGRAATLGTDTDFRTLQIRQAAYVVDYSLQAAVDPEPISAVDHVGEGKSRCRAHIRAGVARLMVGGRADAELPQRQTFACRLVGGSRRERG
jgi:hypothetical protein